MDTETQTMPGVSPLLTRTAVNAELIGKPDSAWQLQTPALVVDLDTLDANIERMAHHCESQGIALRPHAKTHKCVAIARRQIATGAIGVCCAKLGEAEAMAAGGIQSILLTSPVVTPQSIDRLMKLHAAVPELMLVVDSESNAKALAQACPSPLPPLKVLLDIDPGLHRTGMPPGEEAHRLARLLMSEKHLKFMGMQCYAGHLMHLESFEERRQKSHATLDALATLQGRLAADGIPCEILTGGGTGTFGIDPQARVFTELQAGSYLFMDRQYNEVGGQLIDSTVTGIPFETSLWVQMSVISCNTPKLATTDAGFKAFATDAETPLLFSGAPEGARYFYFGDEQGGIAFASDNEWLALGTPLRAITPHCDPTVNLYDFIHVVQGSTLVDIWPIEARGCSA